MTRALLLLLLAGCGATRAYDGPARERADVARLETTAGLVDELGRIDTHSQNALSFRPRFRAVLVKVGDRDVSAATEVDVLPGAHRVLVEWKLQTHGFTTSGATTEDHRGGRVWVEAAVRAGRTYELRWGRFAPEGEAAPSMHFTEVVDEDD